MKRTEPEQGKESQQLAQLEAQLVETAATSVQGIEEFHELLTETGGGRSIIGWQFDPRHTRLTRASGERMLRENLGEVIQGLRNRLFPLLMRTLDIYRASVIVHLALITGCDRLNENADFWKGLAKANYQAAYLALMDTQWPPNSDTIVRKRVPQLALALVMGKP